ncbi:acyltransferase [Verrucomicrobiota bacterium]
MPAGTKRIVSLDLLRLLAAFGVVALHSSAIRLMPFLEDLWAAKWWMAHVMLAMKVCVPLFVLISGSLLLDPAKYRDDWGSYRKQLTRILVPLVVWVSFYSLLAVLKLYRQDALSLAALKVPVVRGVAYFHLWYLFMALGLYVFTPFFRMVVRESTPERLRYLVVLLLLFGLGYWGITGFIGRKYYCVANDLLIFPPYLIFYFVGYYIRRFWKMAFPVWLPILSFGVFWASGVVGETLLLLIRGKYVGFFYTPLSPSLVGMALSLFVLAVRLEAQLRNLRPSAKGALTFMARATLGCYCVHPFVMQHVIGRFDIDAAGLAFAVFVAVEAASVFVVSTAIALILLRIPILRKAV